MHIGKNVSIGANVDIDEPVRLHDNTYIGSHSNIGSFTYIEKKTDIFPRTIIGRYCSIARNCQIGVIEHPTQWLSTSPFQYNIDYHFEGYSNLFPKKDFLRPMETIIKNDVWIGASVIIKRGITIENGAIIAAGAVVTKNVPSYAIVGGVPAKIIKYRFNQRIIKELLDIKWWDLPIELLSNVEFNNIEIAIKQIKKVKEQYKKNNKIIHKKNKTKLNFEIYGHRGDKENFVENTLEGFKSALLNKNTSGIELDINVSKDKEFVINHDRYIVDNNETKYYIHDYSYKMLKNLVDNKDRLPTLNEVFKLYSNIKSNKTILIEIKVLPISKKLPLSYREIIDKLNNLIKNYKLEENVYIVSFDYRIAQIVKNSTNLRAGLILHRNLVPIEDIVKNLKLDAIVVEKDWIIKEHIDLLKKLNIKVFAWTVNSHKDIKKLKELGVDCIITDKPNSINVNI